MATTTVDATDTKTSTVDTTEVKRRELEFATLDQIVADAEQVVAQQATANGNWSVGQIFDHLAKTVTCSIDGFGFKAPLMFRLIGPLIKKRIFGSPMSPGYKLDLRSMEVIGPEDISAEEGLNRLREAISRFQATDRCERHPFFGNLTYEEYIMLHLRHSAMHMSFIDLP